MQVESIEYTFKNPYTKKDETYFYSPKDDDGYIEAIRDFFDKRDVFIKGKDSDVWNVIVDLNKLLWFDEDDIDLFNVIFEDEEEFLREYYKDVAYDDFLMEKEDEHDDLESEEEED